MRNSIRTDGPLVRRALDRAPEVLCDQDRHITRCAGKGEDVASGRTFQTDVPASARIGRRDRHNPTAGNPRLAEQRLNRCLDLGDDVRLLDPLYEHGHFVRWAQRRCATGYREAANIVGRSDLNKKQGRSDCRQFGPGFRSWRSRGEVRVKAGRIVSPTAGAADTAPASA